MGITTVNEATAIRNSRMESSSRDRASRTSNLNSFASIGISN